MTRPLRSRDALVARLARSGLLLRQDRQLPSVVTLMAGEALPHSWWSHPQARLMYRLLEELSGHPDVLLTRLLAGKDTFVHRDLWPALLGVACAREPWQTARLPQVARTLLARTARRRVPLTAAGPAVQELRRRLLVHSREVHTVSGRHEMALLAWSAWARTVRVAAPLTPAAGRRQLENRARALGAPSGALPWEC